MSALFPSSLPLPGTANSSSTLAAAGHTALHNNASDEIVAVATKVGVDSSADPSSIDYKLRQAQADIVANATAIALKTTMTAVYPVGSIYISVVATNPATLLGVGTWSAFATGRTLVGIDTGQTEFDTIEETGGEKTHTLTTAEMPSHSHVYGEGDGNTVHGGVSGSTANITSGGGNYRITNLPSTQNTGGGGSHNNLQPYITVYMWKRTA